MKKINCRECKHYFITFDIKAPYGCRAFGFKTKTVPSSIVYQNSSSRCALFEPKEKKDKATKDSRDNMLYA